MTTLQHPLRFQHISKGEWLQSSMETMAKACYDIRMEVFVKEQNVPFELENDGIDNDCFHTLALMDSHENGSSTPVATVRLLPNGHIGRMAVIKRMRGQGIGSMLMKKMISVAKQLGHREVILESQTHARQF